MKSVVFSDVAADSRINPGAMFKGIRFWVSQKVPQRSRFINDIRANGGEVLPIEKHADIKIVDHTRKEALPGTHSYTFIEHSVRKGALEDPQDHRVGPPEGSVRSVGSIIQPAKGTRNKYSQDDDRILWNWVHDNPQKGGGTDGNEIYKQLEAQHPQHPWQSWRDRWIKHLKGKPRPFSLPHNAPPTPPSDHVTIDPPAVTGNTPSSRAQPSLNENELDSFDEEDAEALIANGDDILKIHPDNVIEAWRTWAEANNSGRSHSAEDWQRFWEVVVHSRYLRRRGKQIGPTIGTTVSKNVKPRGSSNARPDITNSPSTRSGASASITVRSPSYHPSSPSLQPENQKMHQQEPKSTHATKSITQPINEPQRSSQKRQPDKDLDSDTEGMKRKYAVLEDEVPSSSPPETLRSPKRTRTHASEPPREIASTPDKNPVRSGNRPDSPLFVGSEDDINDGESDLEDKYFSVPEGSIGRQPSDTLSEPDRVIFDTQGILQDETQQIDLDVPAPGEPNNDGDLFLREATQAIDLDVPPPDEGWDDEDTGAEASSESESIIPEIYEKQNIRQGSQAFFRGQTIAPDFDVAEPEGGWDEVILSSQPLMPSSSPAESEASDVDAQTEAWINAHVGGGLSVEDVLTSLKSTSMDTDLAEYVLESLKTKRQFPKHRKGVWTESDDEDLRATDARKIQRLESKHGEDGLASRWDFLRFYGAG